MEKAKDNDLFFFPTFSHSNIYQGSDERQDERPMWKQSSVSEALLTLPARHQAAPAAPVPCAKEPLARKAQIYGGN